MKYNVIFNHKMWENAKYRLMFIHSLGWFSFSLGYVYLSIYLISISIPFFFGDFHFQNHARNFIYISHFMMR